MRRRRRQRIPKPAECQCTRCLEPFAYIQITKRRMYCDPCTVLERQEANTFFNGIVSAERAAARAHA
jgi:hypothetical protein